MLIVFQILTLIILCVAITSAFGYSAFKLDKELTMVGLFIGMIVWFCLFFMGLNIGHKEIYTEAVKNGSATYIVNTETGETEFKWLAPDKK